VEKGCRSYEELPLFLNAETVAKVLGVVQRVQADAQARLPCVEGGKSNGRAEGKICGMGVAAHPGRCRLKYRQWSRRNPVKNYFPLPNEIYHLDLSAGTIAVYGYLLHIENRETYQAQAGYKTIGRAVKMSTNTVRKYVMELGGKWLIHTEQTRIRSRDGRPLNGTLLYHIRPIQEAEDCYHNRQMQELEESLERQSAQARLCAPQEPFPAEGQPADLLYPQAPCQASVQFPQTTLRPAQRKL